MTKILTNKWFAAVFGVVVFGATMAVMLMFQKPVEPSKADAAHAAGTTNAVTGGTNAVPEGASAEKTTPAEVKAPEESPKPGLAPVIAATAFTGAVGEPGSLSFNNPDIKTLVDELRREKAALLAKEGLLNDLARRIALEKAEIAAITQEVLKAKATLMSELTNQMNIRDKTEEGRLKDLAKVYTNMPPPAAVQILNGMEVDDVAKILVFMEFKEQAAILENFATNSVTKDTGKATEISQKIRKLAEKPTMPSTKQ